MKVYLSVDIEGITGALHWDETELDKAAYGPLRARMAREACVVAMAALEAGAGEVWVKDAHDTGRNLQPADLPAGCRLLRGWSGDPLSMVQELDASFDALLLVGWHSPAAGGGAPLAHSMSTSLTDLRLNGQPASELRLHALAAAEMGVPLGLVAGDAALCAEARAWLPALRTVATQEGRGGSVICADAEAVLQQLAEQTHAALADPVGLPRAPLEDGYLLELEYRRAADAFRNAHYPGMEPAGPHGLRFRSASVREILRALLFVG